MPTTFRSRSTIRKTQSANLYSELFCGATIAALQSSLPSSALDELMVHVIAMGDCGVKRDSPGPRPIDPLPARMNNIDVGYSDDQRDRLVDQLNLLGDHLAELHDRIDPDDEAAMDSLVRAVGHYNELARIIDPEGALDLAPDWSIGSK